MTASFTNRALITGALLMISGSTYASVVVVVVVCTVVVGNAVDEVITIGIVVRSGVVVS